MNVSGNLCFLLTNTKVFTSIGNDRVTIEVTSFNRDRNSTKSRVVGYVTTINSLEPHNTTGVGGHILDKKGVHNGKHTNTVITNVVPHCTRQGHTLHPNTVQNRRGHYNTINFCRHHQRTQVVVKIIGHVRRFANISGAITIAVLVYHQRVSVRNTITRHRFGDTNNKGNIITRARHNLLPLYRLLGRG